MKPKAVKKNIWITEVQNMQLGNLHTVTGIRPSEHVRRALDEYIKKKKMEGILK